MRRKDPSGKPISGKRASKNEGSGSASGRERYTRQMHTRDWGRRNQKKLNNSHKTVAGAGGLGSPVLLYLSAAGVGGIRIIDSDTINISNLNRQILYKEGDIGSYKARSASRRLSELNSDINIEFSIGTISEQTIEDLIPPTNIIVDWLDNYHARFLLNRYCVSNGIPLVHRGMGDLITNRLLIYDGIFGRFDEISIERNKSCSICGAYKNNSV